MKPKMIVTVVLLVFVCASFAYMIAKEFQNEPEANVAASAPSLDSSPLAEGPEEGPESPSDRPSHKVIAYYFRGTARCPSCIKIEAFTEEAVLDGFEEALRADRLEWRVVNVEEPGNRHFLQDYKLYTKSVVLVDMQGDREIRWKNLEKVWELLYDKSSFVDYVRDEVRLYLGEA